MFEGSLVESRGLAVSRAQRWSAVGSATLQLMLAAVLVMVPLMRPQAIKIFTEAPHLTAPATPPKPPQIVHVNAARPASDPTAAPQAPVQAVAGSFFRSLRPGPPANDEPTGPATNLALGSGPSGIPELLPGGGGSAVTVTHAAPRGPLAISSGVTAGMLLAPIRPVYPAIAKAVRMQGTVVVEAIISKTGRIQSAQAISGPDMLREAALDAVKEARYQPYLLSGRPVEVQTTVTVVFKLGE